MIWLILLFLLFVIYGFIFFLSWVKNRDFESNFTYDNRPSLFLLYLKGLQVSFIRRQGILLDFDSQSQNEAASKENDHKNQHKPQVIKDGSCKVTCTNCRLDVARLERYALACSYPADQLITALPCYLETYFMPLLINVATSRNFRLSPLGLIHIRQSLHFKGSQLESVMSEEFSLECSADSYTLTDRGVEVAMLLRVYDHKQICVWEGVATLLSRSKHKQKAGEHRRTASTPIAPPPAELSRRETEHVQIPRDMGVRYARVSGDWNPHHLWPWSAKLLGYKAPIVHGMWTVARTLALLMHKGVISPSQTVDTEVQFKRPVFLPAHSSFSWYRPLDTASSTTDSTAASSSADSAASSSTHAASSSTHAASSSTHAASSSTHVEVQDKDSGVPHLVGKVTVQGGWNREILCWR